MRISWIVSTIAYTPEEYFAVYGLGTTSLTHESSIVNGNTNFATRNEVFSVVLNDLIPDTTYYAAVMSMNSYGSTQSYTISFETVPLRKYLSMSLL